MTSSSKHINLPRPLAGGDPTGLFLKCEIFCMSSNWEDKLKAKKLPTLLEGEPLVVWLDLSEEQLANCKTAKANII